MFTIKCTKGDGAEDGCSYTLQEKGLNQEGSNIGHMRAKDQLDLIAEIQHELEDVEAVFYSHDVPWQFLGNDYRSALVDSAQEGECELVCTFAATDNVQTLTTTSTSWTVQAAVDGSRDAPRPNPCAKTIPTDQRTSTSCGEPTRGALSGTTRPPWTRARTQTSSTSSATCQATTRAPSFPTSSCPPWPCPRPCSTRTFSLSTLRAGQTTAATTRRGRTRRKRP